MYLESIRTSGYSTAERADFFWNAIYSPYPGHSTAEHGDFIWSAVFTPYPGYIDADGIVPRLAPDKFIQKSTAEFARHNIYFEEEFDHDTNQSNLSVCISSVPLYSVGTTIRVTRYGPLLNFLDGYFDISGGMLSEEALYEKYHRMLNSMACSLHELAWYVINMARRIIFPRDCAPSLPIARDFRVYGPNLAKKGIEIRCLYWNNVWHGSCDINVKIRTT